MLERYGWYEMAVMINGKHIQQRTSQLANIRRDQQESVRIGGNFTFPLLEIELCITQGKEFHDV